MLGKRRDLTLESHLKIKSEATIRVPVHVLEPHTFVMHYAFIMEKVYSSSHLFESPLNVNTTCDIHNKPEPLRAARRPDSKSTTGRNVLFGNRTP